MTDTTITLERIDELLAFLPLLSDADVDLEPEWAGGDEIADNVVTTIYPVYPDAVLALFRTAGQPWWADYQYPNHQASKRLEDAGFIAACSMDELRTMLTACVRGERFSDGFWAHCLQSGMMLRLLLRLAELRDDFVG